MVLRVCRAVVGPDDADDAWSETFLALLRAYPELPASTNFEAWLVRVATNKAIDQHRARGRRPVPTADPLPHDRGLADHTIGDGRDDELREAVAALPDKQRLAVSLHYLAGLSYLQVADQIGGTADAARRAAADGIARLRTRTAPAGPLVNQGVNR